jgi:hypothetical protein
MSQKSPKISRTHSSLVFRYSISSNEALKKRKERKSSSYPGKILYRKEPGGVSLLVYNYPLFALYQDHAPKVTDTLLSDVLVASRSDNEKDPSNNQHVDE